MWTVKTTAEQSREDSEAACESAILSIEANVQHRDVVIEQLKNLSDRDFEVLEALLQGIALGRDDPEEIKGPRDAIVLLARAFLRKPPPHITSFASKELLEDFSEYCAFHPKERFWEALRNWSNAPFLIASRERPKDKDSVDTFPLTRRNPFVS